jgi:PAS domain S-box-containing protein
VIKRTYDLRRINEELEQEIAEHKKSEEKLHKLSRAVEQSSSIVIITDTEGEIEYVNPKFSQVSGYSFEEVIGENPRILKSGEQPSEFYKELWDTIKSGGEWRGEFHNRKKNGELYWEYASISPVRNTEGVITHFLAVNEDITERKHLEKNNY